MGNSKEQNEVKHAELEALTSMNIAKNQDQTQKVRDEIIFFLLQDELFWRQRLKAIWLPARDKNTKYFH